MRLLLSLVVAMRIGLQRTRADVVRTALVLVGVAAASVLLAGVLVSSTEVERQALDRSIADLPPPERTVRAAWFGVGSETEPYQALDAASRSALAEVLPKRPTGTVLFRESTVAGSFVALGAVDGLGAFVRLTRGRLPHRCEPSSCEVLQLRGQGRVPRGFVVVGHGRLRSPALFGDAIPAEGNQLGRAQLATSLQRVERYHQPKLPPLLLANGVADLTAHEALASNYRSYGWVVGLEPGDLSPRDVEPLLGAAGRARADLQTRSVGFDLLAPAEELRAARERAAVGRQRLLLLGGQGAALLLAFAAFAATRLRRSAEAADRRLSLLGIALPARVAAIGAHAAGLAVLGVVGAWAFAAIAVSAVDPELARAALLSRAGVTAALALAAFTTAIVAFALTAPPPELGRGFGWLDGVALGLLLAIGAALTRGAADATELLRQGGSGVFLLALPAAVVAVGAIATARLLAPAIRALERRLPRSALGVRLAAVSLVRRPGTGAATAAFIAISIAVATFAATYRATLERGQHDQAAFALGADLVLREDLRRLVPVREVATQRQLRRLKAADGGQVIRHAASVASVGSVSGITLLGVEPVLLQKLRGGDLPLPDLRVDARLRGPQLPPAAKTLDVDGRSSAAGVALGVTLLRRDGGFEQVTLPLPGRAAIPAGARAAAVLGFRILPPPRLQERGADAGRPLVAQLALGPLRSGGRVVSDYDGWIGIGGASFADGRLTVTLTPQNETWFRPRQKLDQLPLPAVVSPLLAQLADNEGRLSLQVGGRLLRLEVAETARRFPSARENFAVVDRSVLASAMNLSAPGSGFATEAWLNAQTPHAEPDLRLRLRQAPFDLLLLDSRVEREARLREDPIARGALLMLLVGAAASVFLALASVTLSAISDTRDDRRELLDLETQGAPRTLLRRLIVLRQLAAGTFGVVGGVCTGAVLAALVVDVVAVSATGEQPVPPLQLSVDLEAISAVVIGVGLAATALTVAISRAAFRARRVTRKRVEQA